MKIFVTVGTTRFDSLIESIDKNFEKLSYEVLFQISDGEYKPRNFRYFEYTDNIRKYFKESDIIITHAGAGSIYELLELGKKIIIVPNLDRIDKHQKDIANFMDKNGYAKVLNNYDELIDILEYTIKNNFKKFKKNDFFRTKEIMEFILVEDNIC